MIVENLPRCNRDVVLLLLQMAWSGNVCLEAESFVACRVSGNHVAIGTRGQEVRFFTLGDRMLKEATGGLNCAMCDGKALTSIVTGLQCDARRNLCTVACSDGNLSLWHLGSKHMLHCVYEPPADGSDVYNEIYVLKLRADGNTFATGGKDGVVRLYDQETQRIVSQLASGVEDGQVRAHSSKVNSLLWVDANTVLSGGWDYTVQVWDLRQARSCHSFFGPYLCGDGLDLHPDGVTFVAATTKEEKQIQTFDLRKKEKLAEMDWPAADSPEEAKITLLAARYSPDGKWLAAGGSRGFRMFAAKHAAGDAVKKAGPELEWSSCWSRTELCPIYNLMWLSSTELLTCGAVCNLVSTA